MIANCLSHLLRAATAVLIGCSIGTPATAQISFVNTAGSGGSDAVTLSRAGIFRDGPRYLYRDSDLQTGTITDVNIPSSGPANSRTIILSPDGFPTSGAPNGFLNDLVLNRGMHTPGLGDGTFEAGDEFTQYTFDAPLRNEPGADLLLSFITFDFGSFESEPGPYWLSADGGTPTLIDRDANLNLSPVASIPFFAISGGATEPSDFLVSAAQNTGSLGNANATPRPSLQLVDLSELGVAEGESLNSLRIWDDDASNGNTIYVTSILGLPAFGDFDSDGDVDADDIDTFNGQLQLQTSDPAANDRLDLNRDDNITLADLQLHVETLVDTSNGQRGAFLGDANLDGQVDVFGDGFVFLANIGTSGNGWSDGDFNADGIVDVFGDGFVLLGNIGQNNGSSSITASTAAVPEPGSATVLIGLAVAVVARRRRSAR